MIFQRGGRLPAGAVLHLTFLLLAGTCIRARAADPQFWPAFEWKLAETERWEWELNGGLRLQDYVTNSFDRRVGTAVDFTLSRMFTVTGGYLFRNKDFTETETDFDHRLIGGLSYALLDRRRWGLEGTTQYERLIGQSGGPAFNRYRQQFEIEHRRSRVSPFVYEDLTFRREGFVRSRSRAGVRWRFGSGHSLDVAYQFESIKSGTAWRPRHALYTEMSFGGPKILGNRR